ncbi:Restriction modification methylase Eco57I [uncultured Caudovirales phage]|uniref:Restriction modification methylase Eco57I n=1 Tax=uncultured Caudovirales phage TaxID=2100421 RepID=A0A6J5LGD5_9CAUD|nr:Restriction modification methylase Eco57I [uncultured Caudovirales phage]
MKFDVIIGNPPYQLSVMEDSKKATPLYDKFVLQAKALNPRFLIMIIPSRWFAGGLGLDQFRHEMLNDTRIKKVVDFLDSRDCFPKVKIAGGVCYFLWDREYTGKCEVINKHKNKEFSALRSLNERETFIRFEIAARIIRKIKTFNESDLSTQISGTKPFGLGTKERPSGQGDLILVSSAERGRFERSKVRSGEHYIDKWKVITSKASYDTGGLPHEDGTRRILAKLEVLPPSTICTETYIIVGSFTNQQQAEHLEKYMRTKFVRFLISQMSFSQDITKKQFTFVPQQDYSQAWTDEKLYKKYGLSKEEIEFIESMIRPMESK